MTRLPTPGGDANNWGEILNDFLSKAHSDDGTLKPNAVSSGHIRSDSITKSKLAPSLRQEVESAAGADGREVEMNTGATHIQWRYVGSSTWIDLVALADITGPKGDTGDTGPQGPAGADGSGSGTGGTDGREVELRKNTTHLQWRYVGAVTWIDLVALADITGQQGDTGLQGLKGDKGDTGDTGPQGLKGDTGPQGPIGPEGPQGEPGATTIAGITGLQTELDSKLDKTTTVTGFGSGTSLPASAPDGTVFFLYEAV